MIENPFLIPPQVEGPQSRSWGSGFIFGFQGPPQSVEPGTDFAVEDLDAFNQGVLAGQQAAIDGLEIAESSCVDLNREPPPDFPELAWAGLDATAVLRELFTPALKKAWGGMLVGFVTTLVDLSIAFETHFDDPLTVLKESSDRLQRLLADMGITSSMELFVGGAVDFEESGCELRVTPVFRDVNSAITSAKGLWSSWTFVCGSLANGSIGRCNGRALRRVTLVFRHSTCRGCDVRWMANSLTNPISNPSVKTLSHTNGGSHGGGKPCRLWFISDERQSVHYRRDALCISYNTDF
jgi:hypothetical protein